MAKPKTLYTCDSCGAQQPKWQGQCPDCGAWDAIEEQAIERELKTDIDALQTSFDAFLDQVAEKMADGENVVAQFLRQ